MDNKQIPKREEKLWSEIKNYQVATNNARILGVLDELIINEKTGKIVDIAIRIENDRNIHAVDELMFYGKGAGPLPTGSAVMGDVLEIAKVLASHEQ